MSVVYSVCVFVALVIQQAKRMGHIVICGLSFSTIFFHIIPYLLRISKKDIEHKICDFLSEFLYAKFLIIKRTDQDVIKNVY